MPVRLVLMALPKLLVLLPRLLPPTKLEEPLHGLLIVLDPIDPVELAELLNRLESLLLSSACACGLTVEPDGEFPPSGRLFHTLLSGLLKKGSGPPVPMFGTAWWVTCLHPTITNSTTATTEHFIKELQQNRFERIYKECKSVDGIAEPAVDLIWRICGPLKDNSDIIQQLSMTPSRLLVQLLALMLLASSVGCALVSSPSWQLGPLMQANGIFLFAPLTNVASSTFTFTHANPFSGPPLPTTAIGIAAFTSIDGPNTDQQMDLDCNAIDIDTSSFDLVCVIGAGASGFTFTKWTSLTIAWQQIDMYVQQDNLAGFSIVNTGLGLRQQIISGSYWFGASFPAGDSVRIAAYLCGWRIDRGPTLSAGFQLSLRVEPDTQTTYKTIITVVGDIKVIEVNYYFLVFDDTLAAYSDAVIELDYIYKQTSGVNTAFSWLIALTNQIMTGLNSFRYSTAVVPDFDFNLSDESLNSNVVFALLNVTIMQYRVPQCSSPTDYYDSINNLCTDTCPPGYYTNTFTWRCDQCHTNCDTCFGPNNNQCMSCWFWTMRTLQPILFTCDCSVNGVYEAGGSICGTCSNTCETCTGSSAFCLTCDATHFRTITTMNTCPCDSGYVDIGAAVCATCSSVIPGCLLCSSIAVCTSCNGTAHFSLGVGICKCFNGYYLVGSACLPCDYTCKTCLTTSTHCVTCPPFSFRTLAAATCPCNSGYADAGIAVCQTCSTTLIGCTACLSTAVCTTCDAASNFHLVAGACSCIPHYFLQGGVCQPCTSPCDSCSGASTTCTACPAGSFRTLTAATCPCGVGYVDVGPVLCQACSVTLPGCTDCSSTAVCVACNAATHYQLSVAIPNTCECTGGFYFNTGVCSTCDHSCMTCTTTNSYCTSCYPTRTLSTNTCPCDYGYIDMATHICTACSTLMPGCLDCPTVATCTTCDTAGHFLPAAGTCACDVGYFLSGSACLPCHNSCYTCDILATNCTSCDTANTRTIDAFNACPCDSGYVDVGVSACSLCSAVMVGCIDCTTPTACTTCEGTGQFILTTNLNPCECRNGFYYDSMLYDPTAPTCEACDYSCASCTTTSIFCTSCSAPDHRTLSGSNTCPCDSTYADTGVSACQTCSSLIMGCVVCSTSSVCTICGMNFQVSGTFQCECQPGFYFDGISACLPCGYSCYLCDVLPSNCTGCLAPWYRSLLTAHTCPCDPGFTDTGVSVCQGCSTLMAGCLTCSSPVICSSCDTANHFQLAMSNQCECVSGYFFKVITQTCQLCHYSCTTCTIQSTHCTLCPVHRTLTAGTCPCNPGYINIGVAACATCLSQIAGCLFCSTTTICTTCNIAGNFVLLAGHCSCIPGYYYDSVSRGCINCNTLSPVCTTCVSSSVCSTCINGYSLVGGVCTCPSGSYVAAGVCSLCPSLCPTCLSSTYCTSCTSGYHLTSVRCSEICGDGILFGLACDDGNNMDDDGCSSTCQIETDFVCVNGSITTPSVCSYTKPFTIELVQTTKKLDSNSLVFDLVVRPALRSLQSINFTALIQVTIPTKSVECVYSAGQLQTTVVYAESVQGVMAALTFRPPTTGQTFAAQPSQVNFVVNPSNLDAYFIEQSTYQLIGGIALVLKGALGVALIVAGVGIFFSPVLSLEMLFILQLGYFSIALLKEVQPTLAVMGTLSIAVNGYNGLLNLIEGDPLEMQAVATTKMLEQMSAQPRLIANFNIMLFVEVLFAIATVLAGGLAVLWKQVPNKHTAMKTLAKYLTLLTISFLAFSTFNFAFSGALQITYLMEPSYSGFRTMIFVATVLVGLILRIVGLYLITKQSWLYPFIDAKIMKGWLHSSASKYHTAVLVGYRLILGVLIGGFSQYAYTAAFTCFLQLAMAAYTILARPYSSRIMFARAILNDLASLTILVVNALYIHYFTGTSTSVQAPAAVSLSLLAATTFFNVICMAYASFMKAPIVFIDDKAPPISDHNKPVVGEDTMNNISMIQHPAVFVDSSATIIFEQPNTQISEEISKPRRNKHSVRARPKIDEIQLEKQIDPELEPDTGIKPSHVEKEINLEQEVVYGRRLEMPPQNIVPDNQTYEQPQYPKKRRARRLPRLGNSPALEAQFELEL